MKKQSKKILIIFIITFAIASILFLGIRGGLKNLSVAPSDLTWISYSNETEKITNLVTLVSGQSYTSKLWDISFSLSPWGATPTQTQLTGSDNAIKISCSGTSVPDRTGGSCYSGNLKFNQDINGKYFHVDYNYQGSYGSAFLGQTGGSGRIQYEPSLINPNQSTIYVNGQNVGVVNTVNGFFPSFGSYIQMGCSASCDWTSGGFILTLSNPQYMKININDLINQVNNYSISLEQKIQLINSLNLTLQSQITVINQLNLDIQSKAQIINSLQLNLANQTFLINSLNINLQEKAVIINNLNLNIQQQSQMISQLTQKSSEQAIIISNLNLNIQQQAQMINSLTANLQEKALLVSQLQATNENQARLIEEMRLSFSDQGVIIDSLHKTISDDAVIINSLNLNINDQSVLISNLKINNEQMAELINSLNLKVSDQAVLIKSLNNTVLDDAIIIRNLNISVSQQATLIDSLSLTVQDDLILIANLQLSLEGEKLVISVLRNTINNQQEYLYQLSVEKEKIQNEVKTRNIIIFVLSVVLIGVIVFFIVKKIRR